MPAEYVVKTEGEKRRLVINFKGLPYGPDVARYPDAMKTVVQALKEVEADEVVLSEYYERIYSEEQTRWLRSIADLVSKLETETVWAPSHLGTTLDAKVLSARHAAVLDIYNTIPTDPFKAYLDLLRLVKSETGRASGLSGAELEDAKAYLRTLVFMRQAFEDASLIKRVKEYLAQLGSLPAERGIYSSLFEVAIKPSFIGSRIFFTGTETLELVDQYDVLGSKVYIYKHPEKVDYLYYINPPEYTLSPEKYFLLEKTKQVVAEHRPGSVGFMDISQARKYFHKIYVSTLSDLAQKNNIKLSVEEKEELAIIVSRYTIGYGILELLLSDRRLTDVYLDSPLGVKPIYVVHSKYGQCQTNVIFTEEEARAVVSRFRALSGRAFDEAHPILDFDLPDLQTRVAVIGKPLALDGIAFAFRLHKDTPWTIPQFLDNKMFNPLAAGMFSFFVDAQASMLLVGSRGAGKTSFLQAMMLEIPQNLRIIVQEDSVTGDARICVERNGELELTTVGALIDEMIEKYGNEKRAGQDVVAFNPELVKVFALDERGEIVRAPVSQFIRHKVAKDIYEVKTRSGARLRVTQDHSLFTLGEIGIEAIKTSELRPGNYLATPRTLPLPFKQQTHFDALAALLEGEDGYLTGPAVAEWAKANRKIINELGEEEGHNRALRSYWVRKGVVPIRVAKRVGSLPAGEVSFKIDKRSKPIPARLALDENLLAFAGLWLADGCYDGKYGVLVSVVDENERSVLRRVAQRFGLTVRTHTDGVTQILSNTNLVYVLKNIFQLQGDAYTKKLPSWAFNLSKPQTAALLRGLYSGDGTVSKAEVILCTCSPDLAAGVKILLQGFGIRTREHRVQKDKTIHLRIGATSTLQNFQQIGFLQAYKTERLNALCALVPTHDTLDVIPLPRTAKEHIVASYGLSRHDYLTRGNQIGRQRLARAASTEGLVRELCTNEVYWDQVVSVRKVESAETLVYDFSVPGCENFVCEDLIAHNTQELPVPYLKNIGFNIQRMKTRPPLGGVSESEVSAEDALRTALRLGDSVLIVGEVRSTEARALYEAMRVGAVGNVVMGTIHGESAYSIWDRVVNDLGVPTTSFKATDFAIVAAPIRFKGSIKRERRILEVTEVKKHWNEDPLREGGFLQWMQFDATKDDLDLFLDNLKESEWIEHLTRVRGLKFDDIWAEINARGAAKQYLVEQKRKFDAPSLLEADQTIRAQTKYLLLEEKQREEHGSINHEEFLAEWRAWVDNILVKEAMQLKNMQKVEL